MFTQWSNLFRLIIVCSPWLAALLVIAAAQPRGAHAQAAAAAKVILGPKVIPKPARPSIQTIRPEISKIPRIGTAVTAGGTAGVASKGWAGHSLAGTVPNDFTRFPPTNRNFGQISPQIDPDPVVVLRDITVSLYGQLYYPVTLTARKSVILRIWKKRGSLRIPDQRKVSAAVLNSSRNRASLMAMAFIMRQPDRIHLQFHDTSDFQRLVSALPKRKILPVTRSKFPISSGGNGGGGGPPDPPLPSLGGGGRGGNGGGGTVDMSIGPRGRGGPKEDCEDTCCLKSEVCISREGGSASLSLECGPFSVTATTDGGLTIGLTFSK